MLADDYIKLFIEEFKAKNDIIRKYFDNERISARGLINIIKDVVRNLWRPITSEELGDKTAIISCDSSFIGNIYYSGKALFIIRALAISNVDLISRKFKLEFDYSSNTHILFNVMEALAEELEYECILDIIRKLNVKTLVIIDGSLYARLSKPLKPVRNIERNRLAYVKSLLKFVELYQEVKRKDGIIVSISKDTLMDHYKLYILNLILSDIMGVEVKYPVTRDKIISMLRSLHTSKASYKEILEYCLKLMSKSINDISIIHSCNLNQGFLTPIMLGCMVRETLRNYRLIELKGCFSYFKDFISSGEEKTLNANIFLKAYLTLKNMPPIILTYLIPPARDSPLRIEILDPNLHSKHNTFLRLKGIIPCMSYVDKLKPILYVLSKCYVSPKVYNLWLYLAHKNVKITVEEYKVYEEYLKKSGLNLSPRRRIKIG